MLFFSFRIVTVYSFGMCYIFEGAICSAGSQDSKSDIEEEKQSLQ